METYEFWRDRESGDLWAVVLRGGIVVASHGPLHWSEITPSYLTGYDYLPDEAASIEARRDDFEQLDAWAVVLTRAGID